LYKPAGATFNFAKSLGVQFVTDFVKLFLAVWLLAHTRLATLAGRLGFVVVVGVIAAIATNVPHWNWYGFPADFMLSNVFMEIAGFFFAGLAIALVFKPVATTS